MKNLLFSCHWLFSPVAAAQERPQSTPARVLTVSPACRVISRVNRPAHRRQTAQRRTRSSGSKTGREAHHMAIEPKDILDFWFSPRMRENWFSKSDEIDAEIRQNSWRPMRTHAPTRWNNGSNSRKAHWRWPFCSTSFHAICFAARPAHLRATGWRAMWQHRRSTMISTGNYHRSSGSFSICPSCIVKI